LANKKLSKLTEYKFLNILGISNLDLEVILQDIDSYYTYKEILKIGQNGNPRFDENGNQLRRILHPSIGKLKSIQKQLQFKFFNKITFPNYVQGGIKKRSNVTNAKLHKGKKFKFLTDIKMFFPSISHKRVYKILTHRGFSPSVAHKLTKLTTFKGIVPQGAPTSTSIANIAFHPIDIKLKAYCDNHNITYSRFVDDLTFSSQKDFKQHIQYLLEVVVDSNFRISQKKTFYKCSVFSITGVDVGVNVFAPSKKIRDKIKNNNLKPEQILGYNGYMEYVERISKE